MNLLQFKSAAAVAIAKAEADLKAIVLEAARDIQNYKQNLQGEVGPVEVKLDGDLSAVIDGFRSSIQVAGEPAKLEALLGCLKGLEKLVGDAQANIPAAAEAAFASTENLVKSVVGEALTGLENVAADLHL